MSEIKCPVCGDIVKNGKCTFCGYLPTAEELRNSKGNQTRINESKNASYTTVNECKDHSEHVINECGNHSEHNINEYTEKIVHVVNECTDQVISGITGTKFEGGKSAGEGHSYNNESNVRTMYILSLILMFFNQVISIILCIFGLRMARTEEYTKKFKTILIVNIVIIAIGVLSMIVMPIISVLLGMAF